VEFYSDLSAIYEMVCTNFLPIFGLFIIFENFDQNFLKIMAPPGDKNGQTHVASERAIPSEKTLKTASNSSNNSNTIIV